MYNLNKSRELNHFNSNIGMAKSNELIRLNGDDYLVGNDGNYMIGFQSVEGERYYFDEDGTMVKGEWRKVGDDWFYLTDKGNVARGSWVLGNKEYYFDGIGRMATGITKINSSTFKYFHTEKGHAMQGWIADGDKIMYADELGRLLKGKVTVGDEVFYIGDTLSLVTSGTTRDGEKVDDCGRIICELTMD